MMRSGDRVPTPPPAEPPVPDAIHVIATTMSGSIRDQRQVGRIGPAFEARTPRPVRVYAADSHAAAREITRRIVTAGGRMIVSAGGAGTFNAVLEGAHEVVGEIPPDLRLAFLRKGSADLIGKVLGIPDELSAAVEAILAGIAADRYIEADVLSVEAIEPEGAEACRHLVGFGGVGVFGEVPRFTESRLIKVYKGVLGSLFGDLGPFLVGLALAMGWWQLRRLLGLVPPMSLFLDDDRLGPEVWGSVMVLNGDLGEEFPLGRGLDLGSGSFRVVALRYEGVRRAWRQIKAGREGKLLDDPERCGAIIRDVRQLVVWPSMPRRYMVNVDGLQMLTRGAVRFAVAGRVKLVSGGTG